MSELWPIVSLSLYISGVALACATALGLPLGAWLALTPIPGRRWIEALIYTGMGLPPVVVGLVVYTLFSRSGPLGLLGWLFTPAVMIVAQTIIAFPLVTGLTLNAVESVDPALRLQILALGATPSQTTRTLLREAWPGVLAALLAAFGSVISEVGAVMLVGGDIAGKTRVLTTAIVLETRKGNFSLGLALGAILLGLTFVANVLLLRLGPPVALMQALYTLTTVRQIYATRTVLQIDALTLYAGELFVLVGPSGSGKSTLLRLLNFLEAPTQGTLTYKGHPTPPTLADKRHITTVFQQPLLLNRSVRENVAYGLRLRGEPADGRVDEALARVGLAALARAHPRTLSGGERQRAALARALVLDPAVLLLDEPTANLDPYTVTLIEALIREQNSAHHTTIVLVTHNLLQARRLAQRVGLLLNGELIETAASHTFFNTPSDTRTAGFINGALVW